MPPTKKKAKKVVSSSNAEPSSSGSAEPPPVQKKRGRPRKVVKDEIEPESLGLSNEKRPKAASETTSTTSSSEKTENGECLKKNRRKSEPHRAPGVLIEGFL